MPNDKRLQMLAFAKANGLYLVRCSSCETRYIVPKLEAVDEQGRDCTVCTLCGGYSYIEHE